MEALIAWLAANINTNGVAGITGAIANEAFNKIIAAFLILSQQGSFNGYVEDYAYIPTNIDQYVYYDSNVYKFVSATTETGVTPGTDITVWVAVNPVDLIHAINSDYKLQNYITDVEVTVTTLDLSAIGKYNYFNVISGASITAITVNAEENLKFYLKNDTGAALVITASSTLILKGDTSISIPDGKIAYFESDGLTVKLVDDFYASKMIQPGKYLYLNANSRIGELNGEAFIERYNVVNEIWEPTNLINVSTVTESVINPAVKYGFLYNWFAATDVREITSAGWIVPSGSDLITLKNYVTALTGGGKLKEKDLLHWLTPNTGATNELSFNGRGAGYRLTDGSYDEIKERLYLWGSTPSPGQGYVKYIEYSTAQITSGTVYMDSEYGLSIRIVRAADVTELTYPDGTPCTPYTGNDGRIYPTVKIGTQVWLACNLAETKYRDGSIIPYVTDDTTWAGLSTGARCCYANNKNNAFEYIFINQQNISLVNAATYDVQPTDQILDVKYTATGEVTSITLMSAECMQGRTLTLCDSGGNASANNITIDTEGSETISGQVSYVLNSDYQSITLYSDGVNWFITSEFVLVIPS